MDCTEVASLLKQSMGLDAASIGTSSVERAVQVRLAACEVADRQAYGELLRSSPAELQALIEVVVISETWFLRDREAFAALAHIAVEEWLPTHHEGMFRLLSAPCSTGEEPYSIAMALHEAGFPPDRYRIDAVDISASALAHARRGVYGKNSFRGTDLGFRSRYFESTPGGARLKEELRAQVWFQQANVLAADFLKDSQRCDVVFCRNLLIYFDRATQDRALRVLRDRLSDNGLLFVGPSEAGLLRAQGFTSAAFPMAFAFRKFDKPQSVTRKETVQRPATLRQLRTRRSETTVHAHAHGGMSKSDAAAAERTESIDIAIALANQGQLVEAAQACEAHLRDHGPSAPAFQLLGLIRGATGNLWEAEQFYRKALYLDPGDGDTLIHLALLLSKQGDAAGAQLLRNRLQRLKQSVAT